MTSSIPQPVLKQHLDFLKNKSIFITGGTGFFGQAFLDLISTHGKDLSCKLHLLSRDPDLFLQKNPRYKHIPQLSFQKDDVTQFSFTEKTVDYIFHWATPADAQFNKEHPLLMAETITQGMKRVLDYAVYSKAKKVLFTSSGAVYGAQPETISHLPETYLGAPLTNSTQSAYGEAKRYAEFMGCTYAEKFNFDFKIARCFAFAGKNLQHGRGFAFADFIDQARHHQDIHIQSDGSAIRSYLDTEDLMIWLLALLEKGKNSEPYNIGSDSEISIRQLAELIAKKTTPPVQVFLEKKSNPQQTGSSSVPRTGQRYVPSVEKAKTELDVKIWTDLETAIKKALASSSI